jgi:hypothetical protein
LRFSLKPLLAFFFISSHFRLLFPSLSFPPCLSRLLLAFGVSFLAIFDFSCPVDISFFLTPPFPSCLLLSWLYSLFLLPFFPFLHSSLPSSLPPFLPSLYCFFLPSHRHRANQRADNALINMLCITGGKA